MDTYPPICDSSDPVNAEQSRQHLLSLAIPMMIIFLPLTTLSLFIVLIILAHIPGFFFLGYVAEFFGNLGLFLTQYISYTSAAFLSLFGFPFSLLLILYLIFFSFALRRGKLLYIPLAAFLLIVCIYAIELREYRRVCANNFTRVETYKGQTLSFEKLQAECGKPAFYREIGKYSHWAYTNGEKVIAVYVSEAGEAKVSDTNYWLFD